MLKEKDNKFQKDVLNSIFSIQTCMDTIVANIQLKLAEVEIKLNQQMEKHEKN
jgi:hypothetical protein